MLTTVSLSNVCEINRDIKRERERERERERGNKPSKQRQTLIHRINSAFRKTKAEHMKDILSTTKWQTSSFWHHQDQVEFEEAM